MTTVSALQAHESIERFATKEAKTEMRTVDTLAVGEWIRQGDVMLVRIEKRPNASTATKNRQLAPGTSQGSRHIVAAGPAIFLHKRNADPLVGPIVVAKSRFTLEHPEHAHFSLPAGTYQVRFQQDWAEQERRAVRD